jgi:diguanylate cyclase (GGDEF)-like protein
MEGYAVNVNRPIRLQELNLNGGQLEEPLRVIFCGQRQGYDATASLLQEQKQLLVIWANTSDQLAIELTQCDFDCILLEGLVGTETAYALKDRLSQQFPTLPAIILLAEKGGIKSASVAFRHGFSDYLVANDLSADNLYLQILRAVNAKRVEQDYQDKIASLSEQLTIDPFTGLNNHAFLDVHLANILDSAKQFQSRVAVLLIDVNHFRELKGKHGYQIAQRFMRVVADKLKGAARRADVFGRYGESSFLYLIDCEVSEESIEGVGQRIVDGLNFDCNLGEIRMRASASIGAAIFPEQGNDAAALLKVAGAAMVLATTLGGGYFPAGPGSSLEPEKDVTAIAHANPLSKSVSAPSVTASEGIPASQLTGRSAADAPPQVEDQARHGILVDDDNRRSSQRFRTLKRGCISTQDGMSTIYCTVRDQSSDGARVSFTSLVNLPKYVDLELMEHGQKYRAEVRWSNGLFAGLKFLSAEDAPRSAQFNDVNKKR